MEKKQQQQQKRGYPQRKSNYHPAKLPNMKGN